MAFRRSDYLSLAAFRAVEENPNCKVLTEIFEAMLDTGSREQNILRFEALASTVADECPFALRYDIDFIARVWRLGIAFARRVELYDQRTVFEERY